MNLDANLQFSAAQAITATAASTYFIDLLTGSKLTTTFTPSPPAVFKAPSDPATQYFGEDLGPGKGLGTPAIIVNVGTAFATLTSLQVMFQGAPENATAHASGLRSDLVFVTYEETGAIALALLTANTRIWTTKWPSRKVGAVLPRFVQLLYTVAGSNATAGTIGADVTLGPDEVTFGASAFSPPA